MKRTILALGALALLPEAGSTFTRLLQLLGGGYFLRKPVENSP